MSVRLVVEPAPFAWTLGRVEDGRLAQVRVLDRIDGVEEGLFVARLTRLAPDLGGAFVDAGGLDVLVRLPARLRRQRPAEGTRLLVQGVRDAIADKPPRGTVRWRVVGGYLDVLGEGTVPEVDDTVPPALRAGLGERAARLFPGWPVALKAPAAEVDDAVLVEAAERLRRRRDLWCERAGARGEPGPVTTFEERLGAALAGLGLDADTAIVTSARRRLEVIKRLDAAWQTAEALEVEGADDPWDAAGVAEDWATAQESEITLAGGARLTVEPTRALVAVDVDRAASTASARAINEAAVAALARTIAVRQLGGQMVVDFLDPGGEGRAALQAALEAALPPSGSRLVTLLGGGLAVIERPRRTAALHERSMPVRDAATRLLRAMGGAPFSRWRVAPDLAAFLEAPRARTLAEAWLAASGLTLQVERDAHLAPATFAREDHGA